MARPARAREPLMKAALRRFVEQGIDGTGIREVAADAGLSEAALYRHWPSKDDLVRDLYVHHLEELVTILDRAVGDSPDLPGAVRAAVVALYAHYDAEPLSFRFVLLMHADARLDAAVGDRRTPLDVVDDLARRAWTGPGDHRYLTSTWAGMFLQTARHVLLGRLQPPLSAHSDAVTTLALRLMGGSGR